MKKFALMATVAAAVWVIAVTVIMLSVDGDYGGEKDLFAVDMVFVESGTFMMGCTAEQQGDDCEHIKKKVRSVTVGDFYLGKYEVTQGLWKSVMGKNPSYFKGGDSLPVEHVSYSDAMAFIQKLNEKTGWKYRLPTESEWEFAARGGNSGKGYRYSGSNNIGDVAWYDKNSGEKTHPVGTKQPNELGIYDMSGNVWEWTSDTNNGASSLTLRGGAYGRDAGFCRVSRRVVAGPYYNASVLGFRLARDP